MPADLEPCGGLKREGALAHLLWLFQRHAADAVLEALLSDDSRNTELLIADSFFHRVFTGACATQRGSGARPQARAD